MRQGIRTREDAMTDATLAPGSGGLRYDPDDRDPAFHNRVRDHIAAAKFYSEVLAASTCARTSATPSCQCGGSYFVLAKIPITSIRTNPGETLIIMPFW